AAIPSRRVIDNDAWAVEYLVAPSEPRIVDLLETFDGRHGLVVDIPALQFRQTYAIRPGMAFEVGDTGYRVEVEDVGPYGLSFATPGYQGATDTRAMVRVTGNGKNFRRMAMHRYPERS